MFSREFSIIFKNPFLTEHLQTTAIGFFYSFHCFLLPGKLIETSFFLFLDIFLPAFNRDEYHEFKRSSCCCIGPHISRWYHMEFSSVL